MENEILACIKEMLNGDEKLDCNTAFKLAKKFNKDAKFIGEVAQKNGIRIDNCELGQFGHLDFDKGRHELLKIIEPYLDENGKISCAKAREFVKMNVNLKAVRSLLKTYDIGVTYCELGCFKEKRNKELIVKTKTWIENGNGDVLFGKGKTELLELIAQTGSLLHAAKMMNLNYKKAWTHLHNLQQNSQEQLVITRQGRSQESGTKLTDRALELMKNYSILQKDIEEYANKRFKELFFQTKE
ncbi:MULTISPECIES: winged helix-turn-helix domain-containing protein [unclassified Campylobacter]|uniref:winged helix-turn-helix domain-containing protein n=1 Tax=unclassified Campylobacter TaxID=2593542 RepID=UPI001238238E|nr:MULTISPECIES: winged helix-turn-helix domain-containing protein [unclassified Campylobacter]KAA6225113.1 LysR family transcriptional regulator [Campylobacter sp. LR196d]KAA6226127.1 LysR family transcriptional regulator [Campylobacter sp. LR185c]KAA6228074.1 LysR family transcriptional regulator [Campylobacter sp. LR286c]KAA6231327.1 LysR family transcriptional regulator [Campylobacter sp. LR264d]KAA6231539.1 LysR family transcriptional regulator [Campylobacter sp. LR291e]